MAGSCKQETQQQTYVWLTSWVSGGDYTDFSNLRKGERTDYAQFYVTDGSRLRQHTLLPTPR